MSKNKEIGKGKKPSIIGVIAMLLLCIGAVLSNHATDDTNQVVSSNQIVEDDVKQTEFESNSSKASNEGEISPSSTQIKYYFRNEHYLEQHYDKHGGEFDYQTKEEYLAGANRVIMSEQALYKTEAEDGDGVYYLEKSNEFVILSSDGYIRTYFRPNDGIRYFNRQ